MNVNWKRYFAIVLPLWIPILVVAAILGMHGYLVLDVLLSYVGSFIVSMYAFSKARR